MSVYSPQSNFDLKYCHWKVWVLCCFSIPSVSRLYRAGIVPVSCSYCVGIMSIQSNYSSGKSSLKKWTVLPPKKIFFETAIYLWRNSTFSWVHQNKQTEQHNQSNTLSKDASRHEVERKKWQDHSAFLQAKPSQVKPSQAKHWKHFQRKKNQHQYNIFFSL